MGEPEWDPSELSFGRYMLAGAAAGVSEHVVMFPVDTIKTRLQASSAGAGQNVFSLASTIVRQEGFFKLYRGMSAIITAAIPSHAVYFATYEAAKVQLGADRPGYHPLATAACGALATMAHDAVVTPLDVVKQKMQLGVIPYKNAWDCVKTIRRTEGLRPFYASYPTTVALNVPFMSVHFVAYESVKTFLSGDSDEDHGLVEQVIAGGTAGALGGFASNPLDIIKTRIQTQFAEEGVRRQGPIDIAKAILQTDGWKGFWRGTTARMLYFMPSAAITWATYENVKKLLKQKP